MQSDEWDRSCIGRDQDDDCDDDEQEAEADSRRRKRCNRFESERARCKRRGGMRWRYAARFVWLAILAEPENARCCTADLPSCSQ